MKLNENELLAIDLLKNKVLLSLETYDGTEETEKEYKTAINNLNKYLDGTFKSIQAKINIIDKFKRIREVKEREIPMF
ncbi:hypothetical protein M0R19_08080 [Candidatus Pacearchaeota archaeon]|jgi:hypothetical protein|nr:hypothetical protein [Candidatus Pacearchaeota archaeon]